MQIRKEQLEQMRIAKQTESSRRMLRELRQTAPLATSHMNDESLIAIINEAIEKALGYGIKSRKAATAFVKMAVFAGIAFDQDPSIRRYLETPELDLDYKVILLAQLASEKLAEHI